MCTLLRIGRNLLALGKTLTIQKPTQLSQLCCYLFDALNMFIGSLGLGFILGLQPQHPPMPPSIIQNLSVHLMCRFATVKTT